MVKEVTRMSGQKSNETGKTGEVHDWLDQLVRQTQTKEADGERPALAFLIESLLDQVMLRERAHHLEEHPEEQANGFYQRNLHRTLGKLRLKVPRVRSGKSFRPTTLLHACLNLPTRSEWCSEAR